jgi:hypothetical protein
MCVTGSAPGIRQRSPLGRVIASGGPVLEAFFGFLGVMGPFGLVQLQRPGQGMQDAVGDPIQVARSIWG